jgi:hypothetical protein
MVMTYFAVPSLIFGLVMAWTLYRSTQDDKLSGWQDYLLTVGVAVGSLSTVVVSAKALLVG